MKTLKDYIDEELLEADFTGTDIENSIAEIRAIVKAIVIYLEERD